MNSPYNHRGYPNASFHQLLLTIAFDNANVSLTCWSPSLALKSREFTAQYENDVIVVVVPKFTLGNQEACLYSHFIYITRTGNEVYRNYEHRATMVQISSNMTKDELR